MAHQSNPRRMKSSGRKLSFRITPFLKKGSDPLDRVTNAEKLNARRGSDPFFKHVLTTMRTHKFERAAVYCCLSLSLLVSAAGCGRMAAIGQDDRGGRTDRSEASVVSANRVARIASDAIVVRLDTGRLRAIEQRVWPPVVVDGPHSYESITEYYWAENRDLQVRLEQAKQAFQREPAPTMRQLTLVTGNAGVGKTFIKGEVYSELFPNQTVCKFDLHELYNEWIAEGKTQMRSDIMIGQMPLGELPAAVNHDQPLLLQYMDEQDANFYVIDSLDEIHPNDYLWVMQQIEQFVSDEAHRFVHVVVFGRGHAFQEYWQQVRGKRQGLDVELFRLRAPRFRTTGDLMVSSWNYHTWQYKLMWNPDAGESQPMPLRAYTEWIRRDFPQTGEFASISCEDDPALRADVHALLNQWASRSRIVVSTLGNLAGNGIMRGIIERSAANSQPYDEHQVMLAYLNSWFERNTKSGGRPGPADGRRYDLYLQSLEQIAAKYLHENLVDREGYFVVAANDQVVVTYDNRKFTLPVRAVLDRSGLKEIDLAATVGNDEVARAANEARYRFEPIWMHRLLVELHNERLQREHQLAATKK